MDFISKRISDIVNSSYDIPITECGFPVEFKDRTRVRVAPVTREQICDAMTVFFNDGKQITIIK